MVGSLFAAAVPVALLLLFPAEGPLLLRVSADARERYCRRGKRTVTKAPSRMLCSNRNKRCFL
jgi:hypothetical protein